MSSSSAGFQLKEEYPAILLEVVPYFRFLEAGIVEEYLMFCVRSSCVNIETNVL